ncbi:splicing factor 3B subunit 2 [Trichonephila clavipes]|nr:splicing factor 3B subunit 2 [Trichonephila clavipes]
MQSDKVLYSEYCKVFINYLDDGIIEKVTNPFISTNDPVLYFPHQVIIKNESLTTKQQTAFDASACERRVLKEEMGSEKSDEDMELPQATERVIPLESERAKMLSVGPDAMTQPVTVPKKKCLPRALLISADEMCEEKEERSVDVIKETAKEDISKEPLNLNNDEIEEINHRNSARSRKPARKLPFIQRFDVWRKRPTMRKKVRLMSRTSDIDSPKVQNSVFKRLAKPKVTIQGDLCYEEKS